MTRRIQTVDDYLAMLPRDKRVALASLRRTIMAAAPGAVETISYHIPIFKYEGHFLVGFAAAKEHCTFHLMGTAVMQAHKEELRKYPTGKGSIRFPADAPLPVGLVNRLVKARIAENAKRWGSQRKRGS